MYPGEFTIPYFLYVDDVEINNALGSHAGSHSICNIYYSYPCFPKDESIVDNVFLAAIVRTQDLKIYGNDKCLQALVKELQDLEINGINIKTQGGNIKKIHFILGLVLGDNLGLNGILNFSKSFSSRSFCRFCKVLKSESQTLCSEREDALRTKLNYEEDVQLGDVSITGVSMESLFNSIPSFHVVENFCVDVMHDIFEGVCHYDFCQVIVYFTERMKYFDLETLNLRKKQFNYGPTEIGNISGDIKAHHLKNKHLKMSASEMMTFSNFFPLMIGDMVPDDDEVWQFLLILIEIIDIVLCFEMTNEVIHILKLKIEQHNREYLRLFNDNLKPKFHNLIHYPGIIKMSGPLRKFWCFKFESKHRQFKIYSHAMTSRKNICLTLGRKYQLKFANYLLQEKNFDDFFLDEKHEVTMSSFKEIIIEKLKSTPKAMKIFSKVLFRGICFANNFYVAKYIDDIQIYIILNIIKTEKYVYLFCQRVDNVRYDPHFIAYEIDPTALREFSLLNIYDIIGPPLNIINTANGKQMLRVKEYYSSLL